LKPGSVHFTKVLYPFTFLVTDFFSPKSGCVLSFFQKIMTFFLSKYRYIGKINDLKFLCMSAPNKADSCRPTFFFNFLSVPMS
jgi:hypothetical protein